VFGEAGARAGCASVRAGAGARRAWGVAWALGLGARWLAAAGRAGGWGAGDVGADLAAEARRDRHACRSVTRQATRAMGGKAVGARGGRQIHLPSLSLLETVLEAQQRPDVQALQGAAAAEEASAGLRLSTAQV